MNVCALAPGRGVARPSQAEVLVMHCYVTLDIDRIAESVRKLHRLLIVEEGETPRLRGTAVSARIPGSADHDPSAALIRTAPDEASVAAAATRHNT